MDTQKVLSSCPQVVIYHGNCADGFTAAWVVRKAISTYFGQDAADKVEYIAGVHGEPPPNVAGKHVVIVDFSYKLPILMADTMRPGETHGAKSILILDHHKTAQADLSGLPPASDYAPDQWGDQPIRALFDMSRSGALLAWDFFFPGEEPPALVRYVSDRDLWRFELEDSKPLNAVILSYSYDWDNWDWLERTFSSVEARDKLVPRGIAILRKHFRDIDELLAVNTYYGQIAGFRVPIANMPYTMASDACHVLCGDVEDAEAFGVFIEPPVEAPPFAATYFDRADGARVFSLRSLKDGLDVAEIARRYGGGGHEHAAGFTMPAGWRSGLHVDADAVPVSPFSHAVAVQAAAKSNDGQNNSEG